MKLFYLCTVVSLVANSCQTREINNQEINTSNPIAELLSNNYTEYLDTFTVYDYTTKAGNNSQQIEYLLTNKDSDSIRLGYEYSCIFPCLTISDPYIRINGQKVAINRISLLDKSPLARGPIAYKLNFSSIDKVYSMTLSGRKYFLLSIPIDLPNYSRLNSHLFIIPLDNPDESCVLEVLDIDLLRGRYRKTNNESFSIPVALEGSKDTLSVALIYDVRFNSSMQPAIGSKQLLEIISESDRYFVLPSSYYKK